MDIKVGSKTFKERLNLMTLMSELSQNSKSQVENHLLEHGADLKMTDQDSEPTLLPSGVPSF